MKIVTFTLSLILYLVLLHQVNAQDDQCKDVLELAGNNVNHEVRRGSVMKSILEKYTSESSASSSSSWSLAANVLKKVNVDLGTGSASDQWNNLKRQYQSSYSNFQYSESFNQQAVKEAISAWENCQGLKKIKFKVTRSPERIVVAIWRANATDVIFEGASFDSENVIVTAGIGKNGDQVELNAGGHNFKLNEDRHLNVIIERINRKEMTDPESVIFPRTDVMLMTNGGNLKVTLPTEGKPSLAYLSEFVAELSQINSELNLLNQTIPKKIDGENCITFGETQICWGAVYVSPSANSNNVSFEINFDKHFSSPPNVTNSINTKNTQSAGPKYSIYSYAVSDSTYTGTLLENNGIVRAGSEIRFDYVAIGKGKK